MFKLSKKAIEEMWESFDVPMNNDEKIDEDWCGWPKGTDRYEIWHWFDEQYAKYGGVHALMFPSEHKKSEYGEVIASVDLQVWVHDYATTFYSFEFDCGRALDMIPLERVKKLKTDKADYDTDEVFAWAVNMGLVEDHNGPFDCYICDDIELAEYVKAREGKEES